MLLTPMVQSSNMSSRRIHFWIPGIEAADDVASWIPDVEPMRFATGVGHNVIELFARVRDRGLPVSIGVRIPRDADTIVFQHQTHLTDRDLLPLYVALAGRTPRQTIHIRSDLLSHLDAPVPASIEVVPHKGFASGPRQVWLPPLVQRGLIRRCDSRGPSVVNVAVKVNRENVPDFTLDRAWLERFRLLGLRLEIDSNVERRHGVAGTASWHDFSGCDVILCLRSSAMSSDLHRKPATRLLNAWAAGCIPIVGPEPAYQELVNPGVDALVAKDGEEVLHQLSALTSDEDLRSTLFAGVSMRTQEFTMEAVLDRWIELLYLAPVDPVRISVTQTVVGCARRIAHDYRVARQGSNR